MLKGFGGGLELTGNWARNILKSMNWTKRKGTTGNVEPLKSFLRKKNFFPKAISNATLDHDVLPALVVNLDQTPLSYVSPGNHTFSSK